MTMPNPDPANPTPTPTPTTTPGYRPLRDLLGQDVNVESVAEIDGGIPVVKISGAWFMCTNNWARRCATHIEAELASSGRPFIPVKVVEEQGQVGFRE